VQISFTKLQESVLTKHRSKSHENLSSPLRRRIKSKTPRPVSWVGPNENVSHIPVKVNSSTQGSSQSSKRQVSTVL